MSDERINETLLLITQKVEGVRVWPQKVRTIKTEHGEWFRVGIKGMADISGIALPGIRLEIEMKNLKGDHRNKETIEAQKKWGRMIRSLGGIYIKASGEMDAVAQLKAALKERR